MQYPDVSRPNVLRFTIDRAGRNIREFAGAGNCAESGAALKEQGFWLAIE